MLQWLPAHYGPSWGGVPDGTVDGPTTNVRLRVPDEQLDWIDAAAEDAGVTRTDYILRWQPDYYDEHPDGRARGR